MMRAAEIKLYFSKQLDPPLFSIYPGESGASPPIRAAEIKLYFSKQL